MRDRSDRKGVKIINKRRSRNKLESSSNKFPIVGIGASAGGLEAFTQLLKHLPPESGMAFILVQHLDPRHESRLTDLLSRVTTKSVMEAQTGDVLEPDHVYVIPPNSNLEVKNAVLQVHRRTTTGSQMPIDGFFRSLAADQKSRAIGIILSGTGSDGTHGLQEIKEQGGITIAQEEKSAKYEGMPKSAILSGFVDVILPVEKIGQELKSIVTHPYVRPTKKANASSTQRRAHATDFFSDAQTNGVGLLTL
jgi:two-component system CheB/CheR fusion protein